MSHLTRAPSIVTHRAAAQRRSRDCVGLKWKAADLWKQGLDTVEITRVLNVENNCFLTEAAVAAAIADWRDERARARA